MQYVRTFILQAAHLNSAKAYEIIWAAASMSHFASQDLLAAVRDCHGHNFKIEVALEGDMLIGSPWLVDDVTLTALVMEWDNTNLSVHPDFIENRERATTENMADVLLAKLRTHLGKELVKRVTVWETDHIYAVAT